MVNKDNMESMQVNSKSDSKYHYQSDEEATDSSQFLNDIHKTSLPASPSTFSFQNVSMIHENKNPNSIPFVSKKDALTTSEGTIIFPRSIYQTKSLNDISKNGDNLQINKWTHFDSSRNYSLSLPPLTTNENETDITRDFQSGPFSETKSPLYESTAPPKVKVKIPTFTVEENAKLLTDQGSNSISIERLSEENTDIEINCRIISPSDKLEENQIVPKHLYEEIDESYNQRTMERPEINIPNSKIDGSEQTGLKFDEKGTFLTKERESGIPPNERCRNYQSRFIGPDNEVSKVEMNEYNEGNIEDEIWKNYPERPLLPLKPLIKQRSISCVNLVQAIKGFSKKKSNANGRHSLPVNHVKKFLFPENALVEKKEMCISEIDISKTSRIKQLPETTDLTVGRGNETKENFVTKNIRHSLLPNYTWYHSIDAKEASKRLLKMQQNGSFLIRPASNPTSEVLHTLCVVFSGCVYNFHVRNTKDGRITLGRRKDQVFSTLLEMIKYHQTVPITINMGKSKELAYVYLLITPPK